MNAQPVTRTDRLSTSTGHPSFPIPCRFHARGSCSKGDSCPFVHARARVSEAPQVALDPKTNVPCRFFARGHCAREPCPFAHEATSAPSASVARVAVSQPYSAPQAQAPCRFFAKGRCRNGDTCTFSHFKTQTTEGADQQAPDQAQFNEERPDDDWTRELGGAWAKFEDGAAVSKVTLPSDFSAVRLNNLPLGSTPTSVATLLSTMRNIISPNDVRITKQVGAVRCSADVKVEDPTFAKTVPSRLRQNAAASEIEAVTIPVSVPHGSSLHRVDCKRVHCSWHRPTRTAWLNFGTENIAKKVYERFETGVYKVLDSHVRANAPTGQANRRNPLAWTVMLTDLAGVVNERDIYQSIPELNKPRSVTIGEPSYEVETGEASAIVKSMLLEIGQLEWWEVSLNLKGKRVKAQARFSDESHAREAASLLNNKALSFSRVTRLTVQLMTSAKFKISTRVYDVLCERLKTEKPVWARHHTHFVAYPPQQGYRVLKLEGDDSQRVAQAKKSLEAIINGDVVIKDGKELWSAHLGKAGDESARLKQIERDYGVVIMRNRRKSQLRLFGPEGSYQGATDALERLIEESSTNSRVIQLDKEEFQWACRGGFKSLALRLGDNKAAFDIVSTPKRIFISGSEADYNTALNVIASKQIESTAAVSDAHTECTVCWTEAEEPIRTSCGHVYCLGCFVDLCQAEASTSTDFRISCVGGEGRCEKVLALSELQELLSSAALEDAFETSFASYIRRHQAEIRYCPSPDCGQIYRVTAATGTGPPAIFTCTKCLIPTCTACHASHPGISCAEQKDRASGGYEALEKAKKELGIKDCPKCKTAIEKTFGCNHMKCLGCGTHICWVCMSTFNEGNQCYAHMNEAHGGVFDILDD